MKGLLHLRTGTEPMSIAEGNSITNQPTSIESDINTLAKGSGVTLIGKLAGRGLQLLIYVILARLLGPTIYGLYVIGSSVLQIGTQVGLIGLDNGVLQFGGRALGMGNGDYLGQVLRQSLFLAIANSLLIGGGIYLLAPFLAETFFHQVALIAILRWFAVATAFNIALQVTSTATRISRRMQFSALAQDIVPVLVNLGLVVVLVFVAELSIQGALIAVLAGYAAGWLVAVYFVRSLFPPVMQPGPVSLDLYRQLLSFSVPTLMAGMFNLLTQSSSALLLGYFRSPAEVGIYQAAAQLSLLSAFILMAFNAIFAPMIPNLHLTRQEARLNELFKISTKWGLYVCLPLFLIMILLPSQILALLFGKAYAGGSWALVLLSLAQLVNAGTGAVGNLLIMTHHERQWLMISGASFLTAILLNLWFIPRWGLLGAALGTGIGIATLYLIALALVNRRLSLWPYDHRYIKGGLAALASIIVILIFKWLWPNLTFPILGLLLILSFGAFMGTLFGLGIDDEERSIIRVLSDRLWKANNG